MKNIFLFPSIWNQSLNILIRIFSDITILQIKFYHFFSKGILQTFELVTRLNFAKKKLTHSTLQGFARVLSKWMWVWIWKS